MFCSLFLLLRLKIFYIIFLFYHSHQNIGDLLKFHLVLDLGQIFLAVFLQHFQNNFLQGFPARSAGMQASPAGTMEAQNRTAVTHLLEMQVILVTRRLGGIKSGALRLRFFYT